MFCFLRHAWPAVARGWQERLVALTGQQLTRRNRVLEAVPWVLIQLPAVPLSTGALGAPSGSAKVALRENSSI